MSFDEITRECAERTLHREVEIMTSCGKNLNMKKLLDEKCIDELDLALSGFIESWLMWKEQGLEK